jgi:hypothetical protein
MVTFTIGIWQRKIQKEKYQTTCISHIFIYKRKFRAWRQENKMLQSDENIDKTRQSYARRQRSWWNGREVHAKAIAFRYAGKGAHSGLLGSMLCFGFTRAQGQRLRQTVLPVCLPRLTGPCKCDLLWDQPRLIRTRCGWPAAHRPGTDGECSLQDEARTPPARLKWPSVDGWRLRRAGLAVASQICQDDVQRFP